jgi:chorismate-pyruvate lyase
MSVTLEAHHGCPVDVRVIESKTDGDLYSRKITLTRQSDDAVVMFGLVRMDRTVFSDEARDEIESQRTPLGRVLIENGVLREVKLLDLYRIEASGDLAESFKIESGSVCFGRTAMIYCDSEPAIELLEIVAPNHESDG